MMPCRSAQVTSLLRGYCLKMAAAGWLAVTCMLLVLMAPPVLDLHSTESYAPGTESLSVVPVSLAAPLTQKRRRRR